MNRHQADQLEPLPGRMSTGRSFVKQAQRTLYEQFLSIDGETTIGLGWAGPVTPEACRFLSQYLEAKALGLEALHAKSEPAPDGAEATRPDEPDYSALEAEHFGDPIKQTGIYARKE
jgi:hypothetical protein